MIPKKTKQNFGILIGNTRLMLVLIVLFGIALRLIFFSGMGTSDDLTYSKDAANLGKGLNVKESITLSTRLGVILVTAVSYKLFGINDFSSVLFVLLTSIGEIILAFFFGKLLFSEKTGLMAAFLLSFFPMNVVYATKLWTDMPSAFFMALGVYLFLHSEIKTKSKIGYLASGIFIGIGYFMRESALLIALFFLLYVLYNKRIKKEYFLVIMGFAIVFAIESSIFYLLTGDPIFRIHASQEYLVEAVIEHNYFGRLEFPWGLFHYPYVILTSPLISYFYILIAVAISYILINSKKNAFSMVFWFLGLLLYLSFGSSSFFDYTPFKATERYLAVITIPGILLLAFFFQEKKPFAVKYAKTFILALLLLISIISISVRDDRNVLGDLKESSFIAPEAFLFRGAVACGKNNKT